MIRVTVRPVTVRTVRGGAERIGAELSQLACGIGVVVCKALYRSRPVQRPSDYFSRVPEKDLTLVEFAIGAEFGGYGWRWKGVD